MTEETQAPAPTPEQDSPEAQLAARVADLNAERASLTMLFREARYEYASKTRLRQIALGVLARYNYFIGTALAAAEELKQQEAPAPAAEQLGLFAEEAK
jgi:hypothetical protein